jgi:superfamily I DNA/RNA helicase
MSFTLTPEQQAIVEATKSSSDSLMISAYAGCSKTTTLTLCAKNITGSGLALAFNVKIKKELEERFPSHFEVMTLNGLGHRAWGRALGKGMGVDDKKLGKIVSAEARAAKLDLSPDEWSAVRKIISSAMMSGLVPSTFSNFRGLVPDDLPTWRAIAESEFDDLSDHLLQFARHCLIASIRQSFEGTISYDDQIYMPTLFGGVFPRFPLVMVDEAQDLSPLNHAQVKKVAAGRLIVVGDPKQAIYAFRGADSESMAKLRSMRATWIDLPLTQTFRCPTAVVERQQRHAPGFTAASSNAVGVVVDKVFSGEDKSWTWSFISDLQEQAAKDLKISLDATNVVILCRNNAPLLKCAFALIKRGIAPLMLGRDIGSGLVTLAKKLCPDEDQPIEEALRAIDEWEEFEVRKARANDDDTKADSILDRSQSLKAVIEGDSKIKTAGQLRDAIKTLFDRKWGKVSLASGHRSKGLEWEVVIHLDPWRVPSKWAKDAGGAALQQELNLKYVIETRTKHTLALLNLEDFE